MKKDFYQVLGINKSATDDEIKKAYKKLAKQYHPDLNKAPNAEEKFKEINEAFQILGDEKKRHNYDNYNVTDDSFGGFDQGDSFNPFDIFNSFFNQQSADDWSFAGRRRNEQESPNVHYTISISFISSIIGCKYPLIFKTNISCSECNGKKTFRGSNEYKKTCSRCKGSGIEFVRTKSFFGTINTQQTCAGCEGYGEQITKGCSLCKMLGYIKVDKSIEIKIPPGINHGEKLMFKDSTAHKPQQIILEIFVKKSNIFERQGRDVYTKVVISPLLIITGGTVEVPTPLGIKNIKIPEFTNCADYLKLKGYGVAEFNGQFAGNLYIKIETCHIKLSKADLDLLKSIKVPNPKETKNWIDQAIKELEQN